MSTNTDTIPKLTKDEKDFLRDVLSYHNDGLDLKRAPKDLQTAINLFLTDGTIDVSPPQSYRLAADILEKIGNADLIPVLEPNVGYDLEL